MAEDHNGWQRANTFTLQQDSYIIGYRAALSGQIAFVGLHHEDAGSVFIYEQNQFGDWEKIEDPFIHEANKTRAGFGRSVDVDGNLACVSDWNYLNLFHRDGNKWVQFDSIDGRECSISGNNIAARSYDSNLDADFVHLYKYDEDIDEIVHIQEPILTESVASLLNVDLSLIGLSHNDLFYSDVEKQAIFIYRREDVTQMFTFHQHINISGFSTLPFSIDKDILVIGGANCTHIFAEQNGLWGEVTRWMSHTGIIDFLAGICLPPTMNMYIPSTLKAVCRICLPKCLQCHWHQ